MRVQDARDSIRYGYGSHSVGSRGLPYSLRSCMLLSARSHRLKSDGYLPWILYQMDRLTNASLLIAFVKSETSKVV